MATVHRRAWTPAVILLAALAGLCAAQTPLTPGAAPVTQTLALATDTADFSAAMGTGSKVRAPLEQGRPFPMLIACLLLPDRRLLF